MMGYLIWVSQEFCNHLKILAINKKIPIILKVYEKIERDLFEEIFMNVARKFLYFTKVFY